MRRYVVLLFLLSVFGAMALGQMKVGSGVKIGTGVKLSASSAATPTPNFVNDTMTEGSDTTLASHTPELGGPITRHPDSAYTSFVITVDSATDEGFPTGTTAYYYAATPPSADYDVDMVMHTWTIENVNFGPCGHMDTTANTMVCVRQNSGTSWDLREISAGSASTIGTSALDLPNAGDTKTLTVRFSNGGTKAELLVDGVSRVAATTITVTSAGKVGMRASSGTSSSTGFHVNSISAR